ncbi:Uncharacterised protein [Candidatus Norongarragalina meridionalis]|nr:Uncharacterised protein [Candidatus Norongarragalina meridionalis]
MSGTSGAYLLPLILLAALVLSGCVSSNAQPETGSPAMDGNPAGGGNPPAGQPGFGGNFSRNMTDAERAQMEAQRTQACLNKAEGAACAVQGGPNGTAISGTCASRNGTMACWFARSNGNFTGNWTNGPRRMRPTLTIG